MTDHEYLDSKLSEAELRREKIGSLDWNAPIRSMVHSGSLGLASGLTKRELYAAMVLQSLIARPSVPAFPPDSMVEGAVLYADALIKALE